MYIPTEIYEEKYFPFFKNYNHIMLYIGINLLKNRKLKKYSESYILNLNSHHTSDFHFLLRNSYYKWFPTCNSSQDW